MAIKKTLGGDRLGSGAKMQVELHGYERSTHDLGYLWRSTMSSGTLIPFINEVALPGDTFDINLDVDMKTHPTVGPLFGSYKIQLDTFLCPVRLYQGTLHNNKLGIGMNMSEIKLPIMRIPVLPNDITYEDIDNAAINPSCLLAYLGIRGPGINNGGVLPANRVFNAIPFLAYWDIYKNYYANKQEEIGFVIHADLQAITNTVDSITIGATTIPTPPAADIALYVTTAAVITVNYTGTAPVPSEILFKIHNRFGIGFISFAQIATGIVDDTVGTKLTGNFNIATLGFITVNAWQYADIAAETTLAPRLQPFALSEIDEMRENILIASGMLNTPFEVSLQTLNPYQLVLNNTNGRNPRLQSQEGLAIKTYQSDLFNNWLSTEWIDGAGGISEVTSIDTSGGSFSIDTLNLSKKVYDMLNRIAVSGGSYDDWMDAVWAHERYSRSETPIYCGGLIKELVFQEVISNSESQGDNGSQPLGTLAGRGVLGKKHKGGHVTIKVDEPSYIMGIISLTPRIDYSQGNKWHTTAILSMDDFHKPALDEIGFQELITDQMAWWSTVWTTAAFETRSAGKQPAWINYMTNVNQVYGNFAIESNEMFMTLNRKYQPDESHEISDLTTYIDPVKFNNIFADTSLDAQNFWAQIAVNIEARRKMSAKIMPNL